MNFKEKILAKYGPEYHLWHLYKPVVFFGMYHWIDYLYFLFHRGEKTIFWCGSDILNLWRGKFPNWKLSDVKNICENEREWELLRKCGIIASIQPQFFGNVDEYQITFKPQEKPMVWMAYREGREEEYGIKFMAKRIAPFVETEIDAFQGIPEEIFDKEHLPKYHAALRVNRFDGFSEVLAKSILSGQYPISTIYYPYISHAGTSQELIDLLNGLKDKKEPNFEGEKYWREILSRPLVL